jgi:hypothetical protein
MLVGGESVAAFEKEMRGVFLPGSADLTNIIFLFIL